MYKFAFSPARATAADPAAAQILDWARRASLPVARLADPVALRKAMDALGMSFSARKAARTAVDGKKLPKFDSMSGGKSSVTGAQLVNGRELRVAVIGLGWVAREVWLPRLARHPEFTVVALADPTAELTSELRLVPERQVYRDFRDVPCSEIDVVFVLTPNQTHAAVASWFLRAGKGVFVEKPIGTSRQQLEMMETAARHGGGGLVLSGAARYRSDVRELHGYLSRGMLGSPRFAELSWVRSNGVPSSGSFTSRASAGGGVLLDLGWHVIDVLHQLWGTVPVRSVASVPGYDFVRSKDHSAQWRGADTVTSSDFDVEDQLNALVITDRYAAGLRFAWASHEERDSTVLTLHGTHASLTLTTTFGFSPLRVEQPSLVLRTSGSVKQLPLTAQIVGEEYDRQLDALPELLARSDTSRQSFADAKGVLEVIDGCYRACGIWRGE